MKKAFNKENWTGEVAEIEINEAEKSFIWNGEKVTLELFEDMTDEELMFGWTTYRAFIESQPESHICSVCKLSDETKWRAFCNGVDYSRSDENMYVAVAKVLANTY